VVVVAKSSHMSRPILFRCPHTGMNVQHSLPDSSGEPEGTHRSIVCPACHRLHFINNSTGKLLGEESQGGSRG
jgi:nitrite reductase/ring-hydroxylating ferredoxin subunit